MKSKEWLIESAKKRLVSVSRYAYRNRTVSCVNFSTSIECQCLEIAETRDRCSATWGSTETAKNRVIAEKANILSTILHETR